MISNFNELFRRFLYSIFRKIFANPEATVPIDKSLVRKILIFRYDVIGDMIVSLPSFNLIRLNCPNAKISVLASEMNYILLEGNSDIDEIIILPSAFFRKVALIFELRKYKFDLIINYVFHKTTKAGIIANLINSKAIKVNIGHQTRNNLYEKLFNVIVPLDLVKNFYMADLLCRYVGYVFGINHYPGGAEKYKIHIPEKYHSKAFEFIHKLQLKRFLFFNVSASTPSRMWLVERYIQLLKKLSSKFPEIGIILSADPKYYQIISSIMAEKIKNVFCRESSNSIWDVITLIDQCDFVFTPDTSIVHIAYMLQKPVLVLATSKTTDIEVWTPMSESTTLILSRSERYLDISVEKVFITLSEMIEKVRNNFL